MKKIIISGSLILGLIWLGYFLVLTFTSDETKIRWVLLEMEASFNDADAYGVRDQLAEDFRVTNRNVDRNTVTLFLLRVFKDSKKKDGSPKYRVEIPRDAEGELDVAITLKPTDPKSASLEVTAEVFENRGSGRDSENWKSLGHFQVEATCEFQRGSFRVKRAKKVKGSPDIPF